MKGSDRRPAGPPGADARSWDDLERRKRLRELVFEFYDRVRQDDLLGPVFQERLEGRWDAHLERMCDFWSTVLHASGRFRGDPVGAHARIPGIAPAHFDRWISLFEETAADILPELEAADIVARSRRMRVVLERGIQVRREGSANRDRSRPPKTHSSP